MYTYIYIYISHRKLSAASGRCGQASQFPDDSSCLPGPRMCLIFVFKVFL